MSAWPTYSASIIQDYCKGHRRKGRSTPSEIISSLGTNSRSSHEPTETLQLLTASMRRTSAQPTYSASIIQDYCKGHRWKGRSTLSEIISSLGTTRISSYEHIEILQLLTASMRRTSARPTYSASRNQDYCKGHRRKGRSTLSETDSSLGTNSILSHKHIETLQLLKASMRRTSAQPTHSASIIQDYCKGHHRKGRSTPSEIISSLGTTCRSSYEHIEILQLLKASMRRTSAQPTHSASIIQDNCKGHRRKGRSTPSEMERSLGTTIDYHMNILRHYIY
jgi:hypothetical protein